MHPAIDTAAAIRQRLAAHECPRTVLEWLVADHGFAWKATPDPQLLRGHGIRASCTAGPHGLLTNWCAAVDRKRGAHPENPN